MKRRMAVSKPMDAKGAAKSTAKKPEPDVRPMSKTKLAARKSLDKKLI